MEDNITLILLHHRFWQHDGGLEGHEYQRLEYVRGEFCVWTKLNADELCLWDIAEATSRIKLISVYIIQ